MLRHMLGYSAMYEGSCLCGHVRFTVTGGIRSIVHCHCSLCRKSSGTAFATNGFVELRGFCVTTGQERLASYEHRPGKRRHFCGSCGSPIYSDNANDPGRIRVRLGVIDSDITERPVSHNFVSSRACWDDLDAELPRSDAYEAGRSG